jgi:hypothetical protein
MEVIVLNRTIPTVINRIKNVRNVVLLLIDVVGFKRRIKKASQKLRRLGQVGESKNSKIGFHRFPCRKESAIFKEVENLALGSHPSRLEL